MLDDGAITGRKVYAEDVITLTAQIRDAVITNAKILNLDAEKIIAGTITSDKYGELRNTYVYNSSDSLDASYPFEVPFKIVSELEDIVTIKLSFTISNFRAYSTAASSGGSSTSGATDSGSHSHNMSILNDDGGSGVRFSGTEMRVSGGRTFSVGPHTVTIADSSVGTYLRKIGDKLVCSGTSGTITTSSTSHDGIPAHTHTFTVYDSTGGSLVDHILSDGVLGVDPVGDVAAPQSSLYVGNHTHTTPNHVHGITYGIYEDSQSPTINVYINNGSGYGASIGSYAADQTDIDISTKINGTGWKKVRFTTTARCRIHSIIECKLDITA